jgi:hypothetical protein
MQVPERWRDYLCDDYFRRGWAERGHFDALSQTWVIAPLTEAHEDAAHGFLVVGSAGGDGIDFGYRTRHPGLWAFYPIEREHKNMAATVAELAEGWCSGRLNV